MARPNKQGVDYFPLDVHLDDKFKFIEIKYKLEGFAILTKLMQKIYSYGYWYRWTDDEALLFSDELRTDYEKVKGVVDESLERGVFNKDMYERYNILTSSGIQKRYKEIVRRRKDVEVIEEYLLIDGTFGVNDDINPSPSKQYDSKSTQSKVKESKQKENKSKEDKEAHLELVLLKPSEYEKLVTEYGKKVVDHKIHDLDDYLATTNKEYKDHNRTIRKWMRKDGIKTKKEIEQEKQPSPEQKEKEHIQELKELSRLPRDYWKQNGTPERYDEIREELNRLGQL